MSKCSSLNCNNDVPPGRKFCLKCQPDRPAGKTKPEYPQRPQSLNGLVPSRNPLPPDDQTPLNKAKKRWAKANDAKLLLDRQVVTEYSSVSSLDQVCRDEVDRVTGPAHILKQKLKNAQIELRQAESELKRLENEERMKAERPAPKMDMRTPMQRAAEERGYIGDPSELRAAITGKDAPDPAEGYEHLLINNFQDPCREKVLQKGDVPTVACGKWELAHGEGYLQPRCDRALKELEEEQLAKKPAEPIELKDARVENGAIVATSTSELREALPSGEGIARVIGPDGKGGMVLELRPKEGSAPEQPKSSVDELAEDLNRAYIEDHPELKAKVEEQKPGFMAAMYAAAEKRELEKRAEEPTPKRQVQHDLEGKPAQVAVSGCIKVPKKKAYFQTPHWTLSVPKEDAQDLIGCGDRFSLRQLVEDKLRKVRGAIVQKGDFDRMVDYFTDMIMRGAIDHLSEED